VPVVVAEGSLSLMLDACETLIASSARFQRLVGASTASEAKSSIYIGEAKPEKYERPAALIYFIGSPISGTRSSSGSRDYFDPFGSFWVLFERDIPSDYIEEPENALRDFCNHIGVIFDEITEKSPEILGQRGVDIDAIQRETRTTTEEDATPIDYFAGQIAITAGYGS
jgi:hypothetical protein